MYFDPKRVSYEEVLDYYWRHIDPTDAGGQFVDRGSQYRTAVFYHDDAQRQAAEASKQKLIESGRFAAKSVATQIRPAEVFYAAEDYHQGFPGKNPLRYKSYRAGTGRDSFLGQVWGEAPKTGAESRRSPCTCDRCSQRCDKADRAGIEENSPASRCQVAMNLVRMALLPVNRASGRR